VNECPVCHQVVAFKAGVDPNDLMVAHLDAGCPKEVVLHSEYRYPCHHKGCKVEELAPITCTHCRLNHCVSHRNPEKHDCKKLPVAKVDTRSSTEPTSSSSGPLHEAWKVLQSRISKLRKSTGSNSKSGPTTKAKSSAIGNKKVLEQDRIYLEVLYPVDSGIDPKWMFFDAKHPAGRALDSIAEEGKINNLNNQTTARKLALVDIAAGTPIKLQIPLKSLFHNGATILLEYEDVLNHSGSVSSSTASSSSNSSSSSSSPMAMIAVS
jgi:hypothetical protein